MRPDDFAAWINRMLPRYQALIALSGDDWHLTIVRRHRPGETPRQPHRFELENAASASVRDLVKWLGSLGPVRVRKREKGSGDS